MANWFWKNFQIQKENGLNCMLHGQNSTCRWDLFSFPYLQELPKSPPPPMFLEAHEEQGWGGECGAGACKRKEIAKIGTHPPAPWAEVCSTWNTETLKTIQCTFKRALCDLYKSPLFKVTVTICLACYILFPAMAKSYMSYQDYDWKTVLIMNSGDI